MSISDKQWFTVQKPLPNAHMRLFCFPYAGGGPHVFRPWSQILPDFIEVVATQLPGKGRRIAEPPYRRMDHLIEELAEAIKPELDRPFAFFGHSMGSLVAFELTRVLRKAGAPLPLHIIVSGGGAPQHPRDRRVLYDLPHDEFIEELKELNGTPKEVLENEELLELLLPLIRADFEVCDTYEYREEAPLDIPISAYGGLADTIKPYKIEDWSVHTTKTFRSRMLPGDHFFLDSSRMFLLECIARDLSIYT